jgi:hypothetical protein
MKCSDCLYNEVCGTDDHLFHAENSNTCKAFVSMDFELEYLVVEKYILDDLVKDIDDISDGDFDYWERQFEELCDDSEEWMEMADRKYGGEFDRWNDEESDWDNYLISG